MLLRLLPAPTAAQANPPTILFTLSMPAHPYTAKSLPLPANLLAHKTVCLQEDLDCPNVLLGEKSSWLQGIITDVTFSLTDRSVSIELVDGSKTCHAVSSECEKMLRQVCREVELSLVPPRTSSESSRSSIEVAGPSRVAMKRTPSSLLYSLISPLLPTANYQSSSARAVAMNRAPPARLHRRAARSILVDTFRRFILPTLKAQMPSAYLPWAANLEIERRLAEFTELQKSIDTLLAGCQVKWSPRTPLRRFRTCAGSMMSEDSDSEYSGCESTPATSIFSDVGDKNPHNYLAACPPAQCVPTELQAQYTRLLSHVGDLAARIQSLKRLNAKFSREEGKRSWLDTLERGRIADKALKRALSNGELTRERCKREGIHVEPMTRSRLFRSWTAADQERKEAEQEASIHPAMLDVGMVEDATEDRDRNDDDSEEEEESDSEREDEMPITPTQVLFGRPQHISLPSPSGRDMDTEGHPSLTSSMSSDSLDADAYDEVRTPETEAGPPFGLFSKIAPAFAEPDVADAETAPWSEPANSLDLAMGNIHIDAKPAVPSRPRRRPIPNHLLSAA